MGMFPKCDRGRADERRFRESLSPGTFFDIHAHLAQAWVPRAPLSVSTCCGGWTRAASARRRCCRSISPEGFDYPVTTDLVLSETKAHRDRLSPFCDVDPRTGLNLQGHTDLLLKYRDSGARGLGEHKCGLPIDDPGNLELFRACEEVGFPVLVHIDTLRNMDRPGLPGFAKVLATFPQVNFLGHAQGFWSNIIGDVTPAQHQQYPSGPVTPGGAVDALLDRYPNLYCDLSAGSGSNAVSRDPAFGRAFVLRRASRLVFGSDYLADGQAVPQFALYKSLNLPVDVQSMIFRDNARRLLGLRG
jgi:predicted TIM-barrel fold metal-dependent hydrolase